MNFLLVFGGVCGVYLAGWLHGRGTSHWSLGGHSTRALRSEIERRESYYMARNR
jgi:hypothetical protein